MDEPKIEQKLDIVYSLIKIAFYLEGIRVGKGNILPLGMIDLEALWKIIERLQLEKEK